MPGLGSKPVLGLSCDPLVLVGGMRMDLGI